MWLEELAKKHKEKVRHLPFVRAGYWLVMEIVKKRAFEKKYVEYEKILDEHQKKTGRTRFTMRRKDIWASLHDQQDTISIEPHYTYHPPWAARVLARTKPSRHVDISSATWFVTIVSAFIPIDYYEWRQPDLHLSGLNCGHADLTALPFKDNSLESVSCMHTIEHVGLGRYGDPTDPDGDIKAINELKRVTAPDGSLLIVVPIANEAKIQFNTQRLYSYKLIMDEFEGFKLEEFAIILADATGMLFDDEARERLKNEPYSCGCFWFRKNGIG